MVALYLAMVLVGIIVGVLVGFQAPAPQYISHEAEANTWASNLLMSEFKCVQPKPGRNLDAAFALAICCGTSRTSTKRKHEPLSAQAQEALRLWGRMQIAQEAGYEMPDLSGVSTGIMSQEQYSALVGA